MVYFVKQEFPEIEAFMKAVSSTYGFTFLKYSTSYKDGMQDLVDSHGIKVRTAIKIPQYLYGRQELFY